MFQHEKWHDDYEDIDECMNKIIKNCRVFLLLKVTQ